MKIWVLWRSFFIPTGAAFFMRFAQVRENAGEGIDLKKPLKINGFCFYLGGADGTAKYGFSLLFLFHAKRRKHRNNENYVTYTIKARKSK